MRLAVLALLLPTLVAADARKDLGVDEVRAELKGADADIGRCYLDAIGDRAGLGQLAITLDIHRVGIVDRITVATPGLPAKLAKRVESCVKQALAGIRFPARRASTTATVPYFYQRTAAPAARPLYSCWNPKGCATRDDAAPTATKTSGASVASSKARS